MTEAPLILTVGRESNYLERLNNQARSRGLNVTGVATRSELVEALADPRIHAVVIGGAIDAATKHTYNLLISEQRPELLIYTHDLRDGESAFIGLIEAAATIVTGQSP